MTKSKATQAAEWEGIIPAVSSGAEFFEILNDFGDPLEILREAISNSIDAKATYLSIAVNVVEIDGTKRLRIILRDDGHGMTKEVLSRDFWGLGFSPSRERSDAIGEKGHGTKIYLRSQNITVRTQSSEGAYESQCDNPLAALSRRELHTPRFRPIPSPWDHTGTEIVITGYNDNQRAKFIQSIVKDYILWFTKVGTVERIFGHEELAHFKVQLACLDWEVPDPEEIPFGHVFPEESPPINKLWEQKGVAAADWYVKRKVYDRRLTGHPEVTFQAVISIEGDEAKRAYNPMIRQRNRADTGRYRVGDRYGLWICKDFIPIDRVNDWITGFGTGSNAYVLLHAFVNCQALKLTANRGTIANTDPAILEELRASVQKIIAEVDSELVRDNLYTLREWQEEEVTAQRERDEFTRRVKNLKARNVAKLEGRLLIEPRNESELFGLFATVYALRPDLFEFEPLDYNTTKGIDIIARNKGKNPITEGEHWYVELKHTLISGRFNHTFEHVHWIVCWDFDSSVVPGAVLQGVDQTDIRTLVAVKDDAGWTSYLLDNKKKPGKIRVIRMKEFLAERLTLAFTIQT